MFKKYQEHIDNLELKYRFVLDTDILMILITLGDELYSLSIALKIKDWVRLSHHSKQILMEIDKAINIGIIKK